MLPKLTKQIWRWRGVLIATSSVAGLVITASYAGLFQLLEWATLDHLFRLRPQEPIERRIVIVTIDESDVKNIGQWPIPDAVLAQLIEIIKAGQPRVIGLDLYRDLPVQPGHQALLEVFKSTPNLIGVEKVVEDAVAPPPSLSELGQVAAADLVLDADGKVRRSLISLIAEDGRLQLSLGARLALMYLALEGITLEQIDAAKGHLKLGKAIFVPFQENDGAYVRADAGGYQILSNFRGSKANFLNVSLTDILNKQVPPKLLRNRIVLIGSTAQSVKDTFYTSYSSSNNPTSGVVIHANLTSQILSAALEGRVMLKTWSEPWEWLWILGWSFTGSTVAWKLLKTDLFRSNLYFQEALVGIGILSVGIILITSSYVIFIQGWWLPTISPLLALAGSAIAITLFHSLELQQEKGNLEILLSSITQEFDQVQHKAEELTRASERKLAQFLEAVPVGVAVVDTNGKLCFVNQRAQELLGQGVVASATAEELANIYQHYVAGTNQLYPSDNLPMVQALRGSIATVDDLEIHQGDKVIPIESWGTPIYDESGNIDYAIIAFQDITERKKAELERKEFTETLMQVNLAYERFVPHEFLQILNKESIIDVKLGDQIQKEMSILFADIRNFTAISEQITPEDNFKLINAFLSRMEPAIVDNGGFIDKYIGDGIMALFSRNPDDAVRAAIAMLKRLSQYNQTRQRPERRPIKIGIGINTGSLMLGTVGGNKRMDGTVISDAVNLASRLENLTKEYEVSLLISHYTFANLQNPADYCIRFIDQVKVKGKSKSVAIFEVFDGDEPQLKQSKLATKQVFEQGLFLYYHRAYREAAQIFEDCLQVNPRDKVTQIYLERCQKKAEDKRQRAEGL
ncbi:MAG: CHASE2 domain-containing protein [Symploca sp. SIO3C6]|nr:CHASE2 domain-containing protein [Symploca sp. SIO3C6]